MLLRAKEVKAAAKSKLRYKIGDPKYVANPDIYKEFDARKHWPQCNTIGVVHNDGNSDLSWVNTLILFDGNTE